MFLLFLNYTYVYIYPQFIVNNIILVVVIQEVVELIMEFQVPPILGTRQTTYLFTLFNSFPPPQ
tara:strand:- start:377 stop:568 length:192 start_codon:yes stop_codon:yes gene_type:complete